MESVTALRLWDPGVCQAVKLTKNNVNEIAEYIDEEARGSAYVTEYEGVIGLQLTRPYFDEYQECFAPLGSWFVTGSCIDHGWTIYSDEQFSAYFSIRNEVS